MESAGSPDTLRVALVGCGAVAAANLMPVLAGHDRVSVTTLVDRDETRARTLAQAYGVPNVLTDMDALQPCTVDAVILATPPAHHAPATIALAAKGFHVLVEKPMAITAADAQAMVDAADRAGVALSVGLYRRCLPSVELLRALVGRREFGRPIAVDAEEGGPYGWPLATLEGLTRATGGGGVLIDIGSHVIDVILHVLGATPTLEIYEDNARGGIETDCVLRAALALADGALPPIPLRLELSRTRELRGTIRVVCEHATLELVRANFTEVLVHRADRAAEPIQFAASWKGRREFVGYEAFRREIDDWLNAIATRTDPMLSGRSVVPVVRLIEDAYRNAVPLDEPGTALPAPFVSGRGGLKPSAYDGNADPPTRGGLKPSAYDPNADPSPRGGLKPSAYEFEGNPVVAAGLQPGGQAPPVVAGGPQPAGSTSAGSSRRRRVLVTGAGGFLGGRTVEALLASEQWEPVALVREPKSAARLARWPVEIVLGDVTSRADMDRALRGCDAVVHCAVGTSWKKDEVRKVTVEGTRTAAEAALAGGVGRFVHISTLFVHERHGVTAIDETTPLRPPVGDVYGRNKLAAEEALAGVAAKGLSTIVLRPTRIYGPFSKTFTVRPLLALSEGRLAIGGDADVPANMVHVDQVVATVVCALGADNRLNGQAYLVTDPDQVTLGEFYGYFARSSGVSLPVVPDRPPGAGTRTMGRARVWFDNLVSIARSAELRGLVRKVVYTDPIGRVPRRLWEASPTMQQKLLRRFGADAAVVYRPAATDATDVLVYRGEPALVSGRKAEQDLGVRPVLSREEAMAETLAWARYARVVTGDRP